jgi:hypothetical protein
VIRNEYVCDRDAFTEVAPTDGEPPPGWLILSSAGPNAGGRATRHLCPPCKAKLAAFMAREAIPAG